MIWVVAALMATSLPFLLKLRAIDRREALAQPLGEREPAAEPVGCCRGGTSDG
jgi:hypothetical protein